MDTSYADVNSTNRMTGEKTMSTIALLDRARSAPDCAPSPPNSHVAPPWHTAILVAFFILLAILSARFQSARAHVAEESSIDVAVTAGNGHGQGIPLHDRPQPFSYTTCARHGGTHFFRFARLPPEELNAPLPPLRACFAWRCR
jgi:hypothetical protein